MGRGSSELQSIRALNKAEQRAIRRRIDWINIEGPDGDFDAYSKRIRESFKRNEDINWQQFWNEVQEKAVRPGGKRPISQVQDVIESFEFSFVGVGKKRKVEEWLAGQLFGALQGALHDDYSVYQEYTVDPHRNHHIDLFVEKVAPDNNSVFPTSGNFLIELKMLESINSVAQITGQINSYNSSDTVGDRSQTYVVIVSDIDPDQLDNSENYDVSDPPSRLVNPSDLDVLKSDDVDVSPESIKESLEEIDKTMPIFIGINRK